eukprot:scaffold13984_cov117-Isochrysis_galbana.AAC.4
MSRSLFSTQLKSPPTRERVDDEVIPFLGHGATGGGPGELLVEKPASLLHWASVAVAGTSAS